MAPSSANTNPQQIDAKLAKPLQGKSLSELQQMGHDYAVKHNLELYTEDFRKGAVLASLDEPLQFKELPKGMFTAQDAVILEEEVTKKWRQPAALYHMVVMCSVAAAVQGMDESVINGANLFFFKQFGIEDNEWIKGMVNSAPYLCCFLLGCWLTAPFNKWFGRRNTIMVTCFISAVTCLWQAFANNWWHLFIARFFLGLGIGPKSSTVPIYAAECSPPAIRGALVMMWQMWTAFGIMIGCVMGVVFMNVHSDSIEGLNWRMMLASAMVPPIIVCCQVYFCPESPRYLMSIGQHNKAFESLCRLRRSKLQAARDLFYMHVLLQNESRMARGFKKIKEMFTVGRNLRAMIASEIVMFMQQFCGINVIAYYSSTIFVNAGFSHRHALLASLGFGIINFLFALPAVYTIDTFGRRNLLLTTFPCMAICLLFTGFCFWIDAGQDTSPARIGCIALGIYMFAIFYSPGEGPVPFTYSAEAYPLYIRDIGMSLATATTWGFNWLLAVTWFSLEKNFTSQGAFAFYAAWNIFGFFATLFCLPETKGKTLEELDAVFSVSSKAHARYGAAQIPYFFKRYFLFQDVQPPKLEDYEVKLYGNPDYVNAQRDPVRRV
ncbi:hypothetical protein BZA77DRAFT_285381 [Pyronema omphalodes]|nr:hypothetical protein BZA77DRAFT_285381 [Pyronema omphalodes]